MNEHDWACKLEGKGRALDLYCWDPNGNATLNNRSSHILIKQAIQHTFGKSRFTQDITLDIATQ